MPRLRRRGVDLGRCLGCVIVAVSVAAAHAALAAMVVVHVVGHVKRPQPPLESLEIPVFVGLTDASAFLRFG